ncbi:sce7726 family protein [Cytobacillus sp.]|uniref:sce7726 family protein n=1 Tax=Cytobacillus sp. TaxID=2675269 RepID=UPI0028BD21A5|nr:sce7726 family protein [Cytobacillus sp.]
MLKDCIEIIENCLKEDEISKISRTLYGMYDPFLLDIKIWSIIEENLPKEIFNKIKHFRNTLVGHSIINELVIKYFPGEITIKYNFIKKYLNRINEISTFELNVGSSRLDIGRINGKSIAYEIKTELDTLDKLEKQINDYSKVFEYIYIIIHPCHYKKTIEMIPNYCGIITYNLSKNSCRFHFKKKALKNNYIDPKEQIITLTKKELNWALKQLGEITFPEDRMLLEEYILTKYSQNKINTLFKKILKKRYNEKWEHLCENFVQIMPIDVQSFFSTQADPYWVYYKNSSIV